jgi:hypothetical protein
MVMIESHSLFYATSLILNTVKTIAVPFYTRQGRDLMEHQLKLAVWILPINQKQNS